MCELKTKPKISHPRLFFGLHPRIYEQKPRSAPQDSIAPRQAINVPRLQMYVLIICLYHSQFFGDKKAPSINEVYLTRGSGGRILTNHN